MPIMRLRAMIDTQEKTPIHLLYVAGIELT